MLAGFVQILAFLVLYNITADQRVTHTIDLSTTAGKFVVFNVFFSPMWNLLQNLFIISLKQRNAMLIQTVCIGVFWGIWFDCKR